MCSKSQSHRWALSPVVQHETSLESAEVLNRFALQALFDLEATNSELKSDLRDLYITSAAEIDVSASRKAIVIHVSPPPPVAGSLPPLLHCYAHQI